MPEEKAPASARTIREASEELLLAVVRVDDRTGRNVGYPYLEILRRVHEEFPGSEMKISRRYH